MSPAGRDRTAGGTLVLRDRRVVFATAEAQALLGRSDGELRGRPLAELVAPEDRERVLDRHERRLRGEPVPDSYEFQALLADGTRRTVEAEVTLEGQEVVLQLLDRSEQAGRRRRLAALAALGVAIHRERTEAAILERVRQGLLELELASLLARPAGDEVELVWLKLPDDVVEGITAAMGGPPQGLRGAWGPFNRAIWTEGSAYTDDWVAHAATFTRQPRVHQLAEAAAVHGLVRGLGVRLDERQGASCYLVALGTWIRGDDLPAFRLFGAQVAAALDSARDIAELSSRNAELAVLAQLGTLAGASASLEEFMPRALEVIVTTAGCQATGVYTASPARPILELTHVTGLPEPVPRSVRVASLDSPLGVVVRSLRPAVAHVEELTGEERPWLEAAGLTTFANVPLVARGRVLGVMVLAWRARLAAAACRTELLLAMGAHLAAAMEAHGLLGDLRRRVGELTLLNDVAVATASLDPVLLLENALRRVCETFEADGGHAYLATGGRLEQRATVGLAAGSAALRRRLEAEEGPAGRALARRRPYVDPEPGRTGGAALAEEGIGAVAAVPLLAKELAVGALCLFRRAARPFAGGDVTLLSAIGMQLGVAVDAARQHADIRRRARDLEVIQTLALRALSAEPGETGVLLRETAGAVAGALSARQVIVMVREGEGDLLVPAAIHGPPLPEVGRRIELSRSPLLQEALRTGAPAWTENTRLDPRSLMYGREEVPPTATLVVPLAARSTQRGAMVILTEAGHRFSEADCALASALGAGLAMAMDNTELYARLIAANADLRREQEKNIRKSRLEALGELSAVIAHEVRNPLGVIFNSLGSLRRLTGAEGDVRMLLDIVGEEAERLNRIVGDLLDFARHSPPLLAVDRLEQVVDEAVSVALAQPPPGVEVVCRHGAGLPPWSFDAGQVRQAVLNLVVNAAQAMPGGGRLTVRTFLDGGAAVIEVEDTGPGIPEAIRPRIFEPFFTTKATGTGLGLPVVKRIVEGHGGELQLRTGPAGTCFSMRLPAAPAGAGRPRDPADLPAPPPDTGPPPGPVH